MIDEEQSPFSCAKTKSNGEVWKILQKGGVTPFMDKLHGFESKTSRDFVEAWHDWVLSMFGIYITINEEFIAEVTRLTTQGRKFFREKFMSRVVRMNFLRDKEKEKMVKLQCGAFDQTKIKPIGGDLAMDLMQYFTLDGRYTALYGNHFFHGKLVSFLFYLLLSLENGIMDYRKNPNNPFLHKGLMHLIVEHIKERYVIASPIPSKANKSKKKANLKGKCQTEEEEDDGEMKSWDEYMAWFDGYQTDLDYGYPSAGVRKISMKNAMPSSSWTKHKILVVEEADVEGKGNGRKVPK